MGTAIREAIGWILAIVGLLLIALVVDLALRRSVIEAIAVSLPATIVFRAGIGLVRIAVAGRITVDASRKKEDGG